MCFKEGNSNMKTLLTLILVVSSSIAFAGGSGGGGVMMSTALGTHGGGVLEASGNGGGTMLTGNGAGTMSNGSEIVYYMGEQEGLVQFAYGQLVENKWQVQKLEMAEADLLADSSVMNALQYSKDLKSWAEIK